MKTLAYLLGYLAGACAIGFTVTLGVAAALSACSSPTVLQCQVAAVQALPLSDPDSLTLGQTRELARALKACEPRGDAGE